VYPVNKWWQRWRQTDTFDFFYQLSSLLQAGIFTTDALMILLKQTKRELNITIIEQLHIDVSEGMSLSAALKKTAYFDTLSIALLSSGEEAGNTARALVVVCEHIRFKQEFYKRLRSSALMPAITLMFFTLITTVIMVAILPKFALLCLEQNQPLPWATMFLLEVKQYLYNYGIYGLLAMVPLSLLGRRLYVRQNRSQQLFLALPGISQVIIGTSLTHFFKALTVLMQGGVDLAHALTIAQHSVVNPTIQTQVAEVAKKVAKGEALSNAMESTENSFFAQDTIALLKIGEETGNLLPMIEHCARLYEQRVSKFLELFAVVFQPLLMVVLGLLIAFLIFAVYVPIFELSNMVTFV
jgi:type II secretory pathway component PulF